MSAIVDDKIIGVIEAFAEREVVGWAYDPNVDDPLELLFTVDDLEIGRIICNTPRSDVLSGGFSRQSVGFDFEIPGQYCDGQPHTVQLCTTDGRRLSFRGSDGIEQNRWIFNLPSEYAISQIDQWNGRDVHCWAIIANRQTGERHPANYIAVRQSGREILKLWPTIARPDVAQHLLTSPNCGFVYFATEMRKLSDKSPLHFYVMPGNTEVTGSPIDLASLVPATKKADANDTSVSKYGKTYKNAEERNTTPHKSADATGDVEKLRLSGLFMEDFYLTSYPDIAGADVAPFDHFFSYGFKEGRRPNQYFEPIWYQDQYPAVEKSGLQPLLHFLLQGDHLGYNPGPLFDVSWYRRRYDIPLQDNTLLHYLKFRFETPLSPLPDFDADFYAANNPDVFAAGVDMFYHFFSYGYRECRNPSADFDVKFYVQRYLSGNFAENPLIHYWAHRHEPGVHSRAPDDEVTVSREVKRFCRPGPYFEEALTGIGELKPQAMLLTYYLPQFHTFPENDAWWGRGFTEWTNLIRGSPRFVGHYQPRVPRDLGFYTLNGTGPMREQIKLALSSGVSGFVFYYYWFNGKRLMDEPLRQFVADPSLKMSFALMWANENWTRRWDGAESEVLISQDYRPDDEEDMIAEFAEHFRDARYIRLQGRPLLMIYRAGIIPKAKEAIARWRDLFLKKFHENPIFVMAQAFNAEDPRAFGFDGAIEFPPHKLTTHMAPVNSEFTYLDIDFTGAIHKYDDVVAVSLREPHPGYPLIKTAIPSWDNDARRQGTGMAITGSTPLKYEAWLSSLVKFAKQNPFFGEPVVCVNAWNEWCEGAYLEPDLHFGSAYLNATARALIGRARSTSLPRLILLGHDAFPGGAQHLLLNIGLTLRSTFGVEFEYVLLGGGDLVQVYAEHGPLTVVTSDAQLLEKLQSLREAGFSGAIVNTSAAARAVAYLHAAEIRSVLLMHELPRILREKHLTEHARAGLIESDITVFSAPFVRDSVMKELDLEADSRTLIIPQGSYKNISYDPVGARAVRQNLLLEAGDHLVLGVGYADLRKGFDLFLQVWRRLQDPVFATGVTGRICMIWVGGIDPSLADWLAQEITAAEATGTFRMAGYRNDVAAVFSASSVFALTSREDPLPTVVMEALGAGLPVVAFDRTGGAPDMLRNIEEGKIVPYGDTDAMALEILKAVNAGISLAERSSRHAKIVESFHFPNYVNTIAKLALPELVQVSVAVPNFNYAQYMPLRLRSIFNQTYPVKEILVLDDCSRDNSLEIIPEVAQLAGRVVRIVANDVNSGSVFVQWRRAADFTTGEFIWIAEADDLSDSEFLASATALLASDSNVQFVFTDSRTVDADGNPQWDSYKDYYSSIKQGALSNTSIFDAAEFVEQFLAIKNLILNVSAVVWRRTALLRALEARADELPRFRMAGDWLLYLTALSLPGARIGYEAKPLNVHRRHATSVTHALAADRHLAEIMQCHAAAIAMFTLQADTKRKQQVYLTEVAEQLGASPLATKVSTDRKRAQQRSKPGRKRN